MAGARGGRGEEKERRMSGAFRENMSAKRCFGSTSKLHDTGVKASCAKQTVSSNARLSLGAFCSHSESEPY